MCTENVLLKRSKHKNQSNNGRERSHWLLVGIPPGDGIEEVSLSAGTD